MTNQSFSGRFINVLIEFSDTLVKMAGGLDKLQESAAMYFDKFFKDYEKQERLQGQLSGALAKVNLYLPGTREGYRALVEGLNLQTTVGQKAYVTLLTLAEAADQYYSMLEDAADSHDKLTESLRRQSKMISDWIAELSTSSLAPVTSREAWSAEYERQKMLASATGATDQDVAGFLNYAKQYLEFMRTFGGDYRAIYDEVVGDVMALGETKDAQLNAILAADEAARLAAARQIELLSLIAGIPSGQYARTMGIGGLTSGITIAGEQGREWIVPTYEPERSNFLQSVPPEFWENLRGSGVIGGGSGGEVTVKAYFVVNDKILGEAMTRRIPKDADLTEAIRRTVN